LATPSAVHHSKKLLSQVKDGTIYEGILHTMRPETKEVNVVLHWARPIKGPGAAAAPPAVKQMLIPSGDLVQILAKNVDLSEEELSGPLNGANAFETDSEISKGRGGYAFNSNIFGFSCSDANVEIKDLAP
jgi:hypothetical protein